MYVYFKVYGLFCFRLYLFVCLLLRDLYRDVDLCPVDFGCFLEVSVIAGFVLGVCGLCFG